MESERLYTQSEVKKIFKNIPGNTLLSWAKKELVPYQKEREDGRGTHRLYSLDNLYVLGVVEKLLAWRIKPKIVQEVANDIVESDLSLADVEYIIVLESIPGKYNPFFLYDNQTIAEFLEKENFITGGIVAIAHIKKLVDDRIKAAGF